jgi:hypothetical protein
MHPVANRAVRPPIIAYFMEISPSVEVVAPSAGVRTMEIIRFGLNS